MPGSAGRASPLLALLLLYGECNQQAGGLLQQRRRPSLCSRGAAQLALELEEQVLRLTALLGVVGALPRLLVGLLSRKDCVAKSGALHRGSHSQPL